VLRLFITGILFPASRGGFAALGKFVGLGMIFFPVSRGCWYVADSLEANDFFPRFAGMLVREFLGLGELQGFFFF
jgi:hypothetical protein